jgi:hypothetical protein
LERKAEIRGSPGRRKEQRFGILLFIYASPYQSLKIINCIHFSLCDCELIGFLTIVPLFETNIPNLPPFQKKFPIYHHFNPPFDRNFIPIEWCHGVWRHSIGIFRIFVLYARHKIP